MTVSRASLPLLVAASLLASACGGGASSPNPPPPPPTPGNLAKQAGDNQTAEPGQPVPVPPAVRVTTATGAAVSGVVVTFAVASGGGSITGATPTTGTDGVATVGSWTLGDAEGANTLTASIAGSGIPGNPATFTATGQLVPFAPTTNTSLSGTRRYTTITIPAGVTVTMTGDLTLNATGSVTITGNIVGDCRALTVNAEGELTVSGTLNNGCAGGIPAAGAPAMTLVGKGGWTLNGPGGFVAPGDVTVTDDPTATDADFTPSAIAALRASQSTARATSCVSAGGFSGTAMPANATNGVDGSPNGTNGKDGATWTLRCKGGPDISIAALGLTGQDGGRGGNGTHTDATAAVSKGGNGGKGGMVKIQAFGSIRIGGGIVRTGRGGIGGSATATGTGGGGNIGASADATGGNGGTPGLFGAFAKTGVIDFQGAFTLQIGTGVEGATAGGRGGDATAMGGDGHNAEPCPPAVGGPAKAAAGLGGNTPDKQLQAAGGVGGLANVTVTGGAPGAGGNATASGGKGGDGAKPCKDGATGGAPTAQGGKGGDADLKDQFGNLIANGGNGGSMEVKNGKGGNGWNDCILPIFEDGGNGGMGGSIAGFNGPFGTGKADGTAGAATYNKVANGGDGGDGVDPGTGGMPGGNAVQINGGVGPTVIDDSFKEGDPGEECPHFTMLVTPSSQTVTQGGQGSVQVTITRKGGFTGAVTIQVKDQGGVVRGTGTIPEGSTSTTVPFTVPGDEPLGTRTWSVMGMAENAPIQTELIQLSLTSAPSISILSAQPVNPTVTRGGNGTVSVMVNRNNYTETIAVLMKDQGDVARGATTIPGPNGTSGGFGYSVPTTEPLGPRNWRLAALGEGVQTVFFDYPINVVSPATVDVDLNTMPHSGNIVPFGTHMLNLKVGGVNRGTMEVETVFNPNNHFWSNSGPAALRVGSGDGHGFRARINTAMVDGSPYTVAGFGYCLLNGSAVDAGHPVVINQRDAGNTIIHTDQVTSLPNSGAGPLCQWATIMPNATSIEILAPMGAGRFIDSGSWQVWRP